MGFMVFGSSTTCWAASRTPAASCRACPGRPLDTITNRRALRRIAVSATRCSPQPPPRGHAIGPWLPNRLGPADPALRAESVSHGCCRPQVAEPAGRRSSSQRPGYARRRSSSNTPRPLAHRARARGAPNALATRRIPGCGDDGAVVRAAVDGLADGRTSAVDSGATEKPAGLRCASTRP
ncbi:hypothetical protein ACRAWF_33325 [Streptomyces sp. L7]